MNELTKNAIFVKNGKAFTSSDKVAEVFEKKHKNVLQAIQRLIKQDKRCVSFFQPTQVSVPMPNGGTRNETIYMMTRDGVSILAMGFTGEKALHFRLDFIDAFNKMESVLLKQMQTGALPGQQPWYRLKPRFTWNDLPALTEEKKKLDRYIDERNYVQDAINRVKLEEGTRRLDSFEVDKELFRMEREHPEAFRYVNELESRKDDDTATPELPE